MKNSVFRPFVLAILLLLVGCAKLDTDFREFLAQNEIIYTGSVENVSYRPGNLRTELVWKASTDATIDRYVVYWNDKKDSVVVKAQPNQDTLRALINGLNEYSYSFTIQSFDNKGNKSIPFNVNNVKVYGTVYTRSLLNRQVNIERPFVSYSEQSTILNFLAPDTINVYTLISYQKKSGENATIKIGADQQTVAVPDYKLGTEISYKSFYMPQRNSLDTFAVLNFSTFPSHVYRDIECDKSLFREVRLEHDVYTLGESPLRNLWSGKREPEGYPDIYHSQDNVPIPHTITFDMGKVYANLSKFEEIGRNCCHNPVEFEVWGIDNIDNAETQLRPSESGWKAEAEQKGWTLLCDAVRTDDGVSPMMFNIIENPPAVRYIRIRIKRTSNNESRNSNMSEITFWNKE